MPQVSTIAVRVRSPSFPRTPPWSWPRVPDVAARPIGRWHRFRTASAHRPDSLRSYRSRSPRASRGVRAWARSVRRAARVAEPGQPKTRRRRRWLWVGTTIVLVAASSGATWWFTRPNDTAAAAAPTTTTRSVAASVQTLKRTISTTGTLTPADQRDVGFGASGQVTSVRVAEGDTVKKGQVLGTISTVGLEADLATAKFTLAQAEARVVSDTTAVADAADTDSTTDDTTTKAQLAADRAAVATAEAGVTDAKEALAAATLRSPIAGLVATVGVAVGDTVSGSASSSSSSSSGAGGSGSTNSAGNGSGSSGSSSSAGSSTPFVVVATDSWKVDASVDDSQINLLKKGLQAQL